MLSHTGRNGELTQVRWNNDDRSTMSHLSAHEVEEWYVYSISIWRCVVGVVADIACRVGMMLYVYGTSILRLLIRSIGFSYPRVLLSVSFHTIFSPL